MYRAAPTVSVHALGRRLQCVRVVHTAATSAASRVLPGCGAGRVVSARRFYSMRPLSAPLGSRCGAGSAVGLSSSAALDSELSRVASITGSASPLTQMRFQATKSADEASQQAKAGEGEQAKAEGAEGEKTAEGDAKPEGDGAKKDDEGVLSAFRKIKDDVRNFPDIYNAPNMLNMAIFTIFCLCSTGTEREATWWVDFWGVDGHSLQPWAWLGHSFLCNNFLAMTFGMILFHSLAHASMAALGGRQFATFVAAVAVASGALMWLTAATVGPSIGLADEKQFGPWDVLSALFVHQYLSNGTTPWGLMLSFNGWVRYANLVGAVCILWYDPQPLLWGTLLGLALTKGRIFPPAAAAV
eukprot:CAMPEP_0174856304 /NCGR_PEP_ID=MMETSP1114-20130205/35582_1 /TAXON_ID=312471 /ORGANISM="Neobodo designis, Strain CCAP 1951/1" /LENGTH=355 /DNA_ID=CAMNT_0016091097 /DNA_START=54 /DNA_END=1121 /DNA_ORIENTATION=+